MRSLCLLVVLGSSSIAVGCAASSTTASPPGNANSSSAAIHVAIANDGTTTFDGKRVELGAAITTETREALRMRPHAKVVIDAEREVSFQNVMSAVERVRAGGGQDVSFGAMLASSTSSTTTTTSSASPPSSTGPTPDPHASVAVGTKWDCAFPSAHDRKGKEQADVLVVVHVETDGKPLSVDVLQDPGSGFAQAATKCALEKAYQPPRDVNGKPIRSTTFPFFIHFVMK